MLFFALAAIAWGCDKNEGGKSPEPINLTIAFEAGTMSYELVTDERRDIPFTVTGNALEGLEFGAAAEGESAAGWEVSVTAGNVEEGTCTATLHVTAPAAPSDVQVVVTVTDREQKPWTATLTFSAALSPVTTENLSAEGCANCYLVADAGEYMFDAAKRGNGAGDGAEITLEEGMTADWLWVTKGMEEVLSDIHLDAAAGRIFFTATKQARGNALVVLADADGNIVWSWHLWFTEQPGTVAYENGRVMMDRSLGAAGKTPGSAEAYGLYYQWGRKDPFCGGTTTETSAETMKQAVENTVVNPRFAETQVWKQETGAAISTIEYAAAHPMSFLSNKGTTGNYDWLAKPRVDLWASQKTMYDPCPAGYKVPDYDTWENFADAEDRYIDGVSEWNGELYGMTYTYNGVTDWYPAQGYRFRTAGNLTGLGTTRTGHYWANRRSGSTVSKFYISKKLSSGKLLQPQSDELHPASGYNIRCCKE